MSTNPAVEQSKIITWSESPCNQSGRKGKSLWRTWFARAALYLFFTVISANEVMFYPTFVCLFVYLSVCYRPHVKTTDRAFVKILPGELIKYFDCRRLQECLS